MTKTPENPQSKGWTQGRRSRQSAAIKNWTPWAQSTGPRSASGKRRSSRNSFKHGRRRSEAIVLRALLTNQKRLHAAAASYAHHKNTTNELLKNPGLRMLDGAVQDGVKLIWMLLCPSIMQKPCILGPPEGKS